MPGPAFGSQQQQDLGKVTGKLSHRKGVLINSQPHAEVIKKANGNLVTSEIM